MKYLNKLATVCCSAALGLLALTSCEGGDLYSIMSPDWMSSRIDSIANANSEVVFMKQGYTIGLGEQLLKVMAKL